MGKFPDQETLCEAGKALRELGLPVDLHSPFQMEKAAEALALKPSRVRWMGLLGGVAGGGGAYLIAWYCNAVDFPINVGGRPLNSAPAFIPLTFEGAVLTSATLIFLSFLALCGLPRLYHPTFEVEEFQETSIDAFWASVVVAGEREAAEHAAAHLRELGALAVAIAPDRSVQEVRV